MHGLLRLPVFVAQTQRASESSSGSLSSPPRCSPSPHCAAADAAASAVLGSLSPCPPLGLFFFFFIPCILLLFTFPL